MDVFHYHPETSEFLGVSQADENPMRPGDFLIPAFAATVAPPAAQVGFYRAFIDGEWVQVAIPPDPVDVDGNIRNAPAGLFGGPQLVEMFNGH